MADTQALAQHVLALLTQSKADYKLFEHREALTYEDLAAVQQETGFHGTEMKCMVLKADDQLFVYITLQGKRVNMEAIKETLQAKKVRLSTAEELAEHFGAKPGCAYPFGFDAQYPIYIDPAIYEEEWLLFSPVLPTRTVQIKGGDLKKIYEHLENPIQVVTTFNQ